MKEFREVKERNLELEQEIFFIKPSDSKVDPALIKQIKTASFHILFFFQLKTTQQHTTNIIQHNSFPINSKKK